MTPTLTTAPTVASLSELTSHLQNLVQWVIVAVVVIMVAVGAAFILVPKWRIRRYRVAAQLDERTIQRLKEELLTFVKDESPTRGIAVPLGKFWKGRGISTADRHMVLEGLFQRKILFPAYSTDQMVSFFQVLSWKLFASPPPYVKLSDRDWNQLANGQKTAVTVKKLIGTQNKIKKQKNSKTVVKDVQDSAVAVGTRNNVKNRGGRIEALSSEDLVRLIGALRHDARFLPHREREEAESTADALEADLTADRMSSALRKTNALLDVVSKAAGAWTATSAVLSTIGGAH